MLDFSLIQSFIFATGFRHSLAYSSRSPPKPRLRGGAEAFLQQQRSEQLAGVPLKLKWTIFTLALRLREKIQYFSVRAGKRQPAQLGHRTPASMFKRPGRRVGEFNAIDVHRDPVASDRVVNLMQKLEGESTRAKQFLRQLSALGPAPAPVHLRVGKFPQPGVDRAGRALADEVTSIPFDDERSTAAFG